MLIACWLALFSGTVAVHYYGDAVRWHAHEMLFGYTVAVIAGFLLTAVRNWTGRDTPSGGSLGALLLVWLLPRILCWLPGVPGPLVAAADMVFLPLLAIILWRRLRHGTNRFNLVFPVVLAGMAVANALMHADALGLGKGLGAPGYQLMLDLVVLLLLLLGGRVTPSFTRNAVPGANPRRWIVLERAVFVLAVTVGMSHALWPAHSVTGVLSCALGLATVLRVAGWFHPGITRVPILAVLHLGFLLLGVGLLLEGLSVFQVFPAGLARHATTIGGLGLITLGMMSRVALGHTGRVMRSSGAVNAAFVLLVLAALFRVVAPYLLPAQYPLWINLAGGIWITGFVLFIVVYVPILFRRRIDDQAG